jgi:hypothetical protein
MLLIDDLLLAPFKGWNLSRFAGVSVAGARRRNPERSEGSPRRLEVAFASH